jgi:PAS domain S-box-containing protein
MEDVLASIPEAVAVVRGTQTIYVNAAFTRIFGYTAEEVIGRNLREFLVPQTLRHEITRVRKAVDQFGSASLETLRMKKDGGLLDVALEAGRWW